MGFPQGAVWSPGFWNFFTEDLDEVGFADDFHGFAVDPSLDEISGSLNCCGQFADLG